MKQSTNLALALLTFSLMPLLAEPDRSVGTQRRAWAGCSKSEISRRLDEAIRSNHHRRAEM